MFDFSVILETKTWFAYLFYIPKTENLTLVTSFMIRESDKWLKWQ